MIDLTQSQHNHIVEALSKYIKALPLNLRQGVNYPEEEEVKIRKGKE